MGVEADATVLPRPYRITMRCMVNRKALFVTSGGHLGLSWPVVEVGDEVWILDGANTPFLLRQCTKNTQHNHRHIVGDVYVNGLMHGESVTKAQASAPVILVYLALHHVHNRATIRVIVGKRLKGCGTGSKYFNFSNCILNVSSTLINHS